MFPGVFFCTAGIQGGEFLPATDQLVLIGEKAQECLRIRFDEAFQGFIAVTERRRNFKSSRPVLPGGQVRNRAHHRPHQSRHMEVRVDERTADALEPGRERVILLENDLPDNY